MPEQPTTTPAGRDRARSRRRRDLGAFYTPAHAVTHMVSLLRHLDDDARVLEPSGGDGAFVTALTGHIDPERVDVWDLDPTVEAHVTRLGARFTCRDALLDRPLPAGRYTHVIGNPPYLNKQSQYVKDHRAQLRHRYAEIGANDTYAMFTYMALQQVADAGQLVFLISDTFLTLGTHRKLREHLLATTTITSITLLPGGTFPDAAVRTAILNVTKTPAPTGHCMVVHDLRDEPPGEYTRGTRHTVPQGELGSNPGAVFAFAPQHREVLAVMKVCPPLVDLLDGGLGMYTRDNAAFLGVVSYDGTTHAKPAPGMPTITEEKVDGTTWRLYHKRGGSARWWAPAEHCVRWDPQSQDRYGIPATAMAGTAPDGSSRPGFLISGIASQLTARVMAPGALWESNKAFGFFPKDPGRHPPEFFVAILNSSWYAAAARALNHTTSLQIRDIKTLPMLPFTPDEVDRLALLGRAGINETRAGAMVAASLSREIDELVTAAAHRVLNVTRTA